MSEAVVSSQKPRVALSWDDDPYDGTGVMMGVYATAEAAAGSYNIMCWHGERMVPEWVHSDGVTEGTATKYGSGAPVTLIIDGKEEVLAKTRSRDEAIVEAKRWCEEHQASILHRM